jgi:hypothetical protein
MANGGGLDCRSPFAILKAIRTQEISDNKKASVAGED